MIAVAGCVAQAEGEEIVRRAPFVDMVFGPQTYHRLPEMVARAARGAGAVLDTDFPVDAKFDHLPAEATAPGLSAFLTVQEGCDKFCTFCVVPYTRGAEFSRPVASVLAEARAWSRRAPSSSRCWARTSTPITVSTSAATLIGLAGLVARLAEIDGLARIRYTTSHPRDMDEALIAAHRDVPKLMPFLHLPVQSGSDRILAAMNRQHGADSVSPVMIETLRAARPDLALSSDFIVGFPGESDADFAAPRSIWCARSASPGVFVQIQPAPRHAGRVHGSPGAGRRARMRGCRSCRRCCMTATESFNAATVGRVVPVLLERQGAPWRTDGRAHALSPGRAFVRRHRHCIGAIVDVQIVSATAITA